MVKKCILHNKYRIYIIISHHFIIMYWSLSKLMNAIKYLKIDLALANLNIHVKIFIMFLFILLVIK